MSSRFTQWRSFVYVSLVYAGFGIVLGLIIGFAAMIMGSLLFTFENKFTPIAIMLFSAIGSGVFGLLAGVSSVDSAYRENKRFLLSFLGNSPAEITADIRRSATGEKQIRMTKVDFLEHHHHLEIIDPTSLLIIENNIYGEVKPIYLQKHKIQWVAMVTEINSEVKHFSGLPPELTNNSDDRTQLPNPQIITIGQVDSDVFLFRFTKMGDYAGDTWHQSVQEAKKQAAFEYGVIDDTWQRVPVDIDDVIQYAYESNQEN